MRRLYLFLAASLFAAALFLLYRRLSTDNPTPAASAASAKKYRNVGEIAFDPATDRADFERCQSYDGVPEYYNINTTYTGGTQALRRQFVRDTTLPRSAADHGYVTIRFLINCRGETDRFRVLQIDTAYQPKRFAAPLVQALLNRTRALRGWQPGTYTPLGLLRPEALDSYYYLVFKIADGQVVDVLP